MVLGHAAAQAPPRQGLWFGHLNALIMFTGCFEVGHSQSSIVNYFPWCSRSRLDILGAFLWETTRESTPRGRLFPKAREYFPQFAPVMSWSNISLQVSLHIPARCISHCHFAVSHLDISVKPFRDTYVFGVLSPVSVSAGVLVFERKWQFYVDCYECKQGCTGMGFWVFLASTLEQDFELLRGRLGGSASRWVTAGSALQHEAVKVTKILCHDTSCISMYFHAKK